MNKEKTINFAGSIIIFFVLLFAYSKFGPALPISVSTQQRGEPFVVMGEGKIAVVQDIAKITLGIEESGSSLESIQDSVNSKSENLTKQLKKLGIDESDTKTVSYQVYPNYDYKNPARNITGYRVSTSYEVTLKEFDKINEVLSISSSQGVNSVGNINFEVNEESKNEALQKAREEAVEKAKEKAKGLASASGIALGKIINVSENQNSNFPRPMGLMERAVGSEDIQVQPDIQPGETELLVTVTLSYEVR